MRKKLAVLLAATLALGSISFPAYAADEADYDSVEWEVVGDAVEEEGEDQGYGEDLGGVVDGEDEYLDIVVDGEDDLAGEADGEDDLAGEELVDIEVEEGEEETDLLGAQDKDQQVDVTWSYKNGQIYGDYTYGEKKGKDIQASSWASTPANREDTLTTGTKTKEDGTSDFYQQITVTEHNLTRVTNDFLATEAVRNNNWQTRVTATLKDAVNDVDVTKSFYLYDAVLNGLGTDATLASLDTQVFEKVTKAATCVDKGTKDVYTYYLVPGHDKYSGNVEPKASDVVSIVKTVAEYDADLTDPTAHHWVEGTPVYKNIFNTQLKDGEIVTVDEDLPGWYYFTRNDECELCGEKRTVLLSDDGKSWIISGTEKKGASSGYNDTVTENANVTLPAIPISDVAKNNYWSADYTTNTTTVKTPDWYATSTVEGKTVTTFYSSYLPAVKGDITEGWARDFKNIRYFKTVDGLTTIKVTYKADGRVDKLAFFEGSTTGIDASKFNVGFYGYTDAKKAISTNDEDFELINCEKEGSYIGYTRRSNSGKLTDDSGYTTVKVGKHHSPIADPEIFIYAADLKNVVVRDGTTNRIITNEGKEVYNYKQYNLTANKYPNKNGYERADENLKEPKVVLGYVFKKNARVINLVCNTKISYYQIKRCRCEEHLYTTDEKKPWNEYWRSDAIVLDESTVHVHGQKVDVSEFADDTYKGNPTATQDTLYNIMIGLRNGGYIKRELVKSEDWQGYREWYKDAHYPYASHYVAYYTHVDTDGTKHYRRVDLTEVDGKNGLAGSNFKLITMSEDTSTCDKPGEMTLKFLCEVCKKYVDDTVVPVLAHGATPEELPEYVITKQPTCTEEGEATKVTHCIICGTVLKTIEKTPIKKLKHVADNPVPEFTGDVVVARDNVLGKEWNAVVIGVQVYDTEHKLLSAAAKSYNTPNPIDLLTIPVYSSTVPHQVGHDSNLLHVSASQAIHCKNCGTLLENTKLDHLYVKDLQIDDRNGGTIVLSAVYTVKDEKNKDKELTTDYKAIYYSDRVAYLDRVNPSTHNHKWDDGVVIKEPTTTEPGQKLFTCTVCGTTKIEEIPVVPTVKNGIVKDEDGIYRKYVDGKLDSNYKGMFEQDGVKYFVNAGVVPSNLNGMANAPDGKFYYFNGGIVDKTATNIAPYGGTWFYIKNGEFDSTFNGIVDYDGTKFVFFNGTLCKDAEGLWQYPGTNDWYYMSGGWIHTEINGLALYDGALFYLKNGKVDWTFNGKAVYNGAVFDVVNGAVYL